MKKIILIFAAALSIANNLSAQNVGIGTTTPQVKLHVTDSVSAIAQAIKLQGNNPFIGFYSLANSYKGYLWENGSGMQLATTTPGSVITMAPNFTPTTYFLSDGTVGIGTNTPSQKLDVNGNINVSGNLSVNNVAGQANQVLMTNNSGSTFWGNIGDYKNVASFTQSGMWTISARVTKIRIEAWGGGGGGAICGGGAGGTYIRTTELTVAAGIITITIGAGGAGAATDLVGGSDGGNTDISGSFGNFTASGGGGGYILAGGYGSFYALAGSSNTQFVSMSGTSTIYEYSERTAGQFVEIAKNGSGSGVAPFYVSNSGGMYVKDSNSLIKYAYPPGTNISGSGGGGGFTATGWGRDGARGMVIIYF